MFKIRLNVVKPYALNKCSFFVVYVLAMGFKPTTSTQGFLNVLKVQLHNQAIHLVNLF